jgi:phosphatidylserine decarboxylase
MTLRLQVARLFGQDNINFLITNRIPRRLLGRLLGRFSKIEQPLIRDLSIAVWRFFSDVELSDAKTTRFRSLHDGFTRELKDGARPIDGRDDILVSPCDAIVGACGTIAGTELLQIKGSAYRLEDVLPDHDRDLIDAYRDGRYATLRLTAGMYHRFHAPHDCHVGRVTYIPGDRWNVNPIALRRIEGLFCKNERAIIRMRLAATALPLTLVPVAAVLVSGIRLHFLDLSADRTQSEARVFLCNVNLAKGQQMGWFEHGSTILVFAPAGVPLCDGISEGAVIRVGQPLMQLPR